MDTQDFVDDVFSFDGELSAILRFTIKVDGMTAILRHTYLIGKGRRENDAEHSWHIALMALLFSKYAPPAVNKDRAIQMLLVHDLVELGAGDTFAFDEEANKSKAARENLAADELYSTLPEPLGSNLRRLWEEFEECKSLDAKFAACMDRLQPFIHNMATGGATWIEGSVKKSQVLSRMALIKTTLPEVWKWIEKCLDKAILNGWIINDEAEFS